MMFKVEITDGENTNNTMGEIPPCFTDGDDFIATMLKASAPWHLMQD